MRKKTKKVEFEKISTSNLGWCTIEIPEGATHVEAELDYSNCYYENDAPSCIVHFFKEKKNA